MPCCSIINCSNTTKKNGAVNRGISFHHFPHDPNVKEKWIEATGNKDWFPTKHSTICSIHFNKASYVEGKERRILMKTAYPTIEILKTMNNEENHDPDLTPKEASPLLKKIKLEKDVLFVDINEPSTSNQNIPKEKNLIDKLNLTQQIVENQKKEIKRLTEQNRRKAKKIEKLMTLLVTLKKKYLNDEQATSLLTTNVTTKELGATSSESSSEG